MANIITHTTNAREGMGEGSLQSLLVDCRLLRPSGYSVAMQKAENK